MLAEPEQYKGIRFIRISSLPGRQKEVIRKNYSREGVIKILKEDSLINDCIVYDDYVRWYIQFIETLERNERLAIQQENSNSLALERK